MASFVHSPPLLSHRYRHRQFLRCNRRPASKPRTVAELVTGESSECKHCSSRGGNYDCRRYEVYRSYHRLEGMPTGTPPVHVRINAVPIRFSGSDTRVHSTQLQDTATTFDIVPKLAANPRTLIRLLAGRCVPAVVRTRTVRWPLHPRAAARVERIAHPDRPQTCLTRVVHDVRLYRGCSCPSCDESHSKSVGLSLYSANCWHFADAVVTLINGRSRDL